MKPEEYRQRVYDSLPKYANGNINYKTISAIARASLNGHTITDGNGDVIGVRLPGKPIVINRTRTNSNPEK